MSRSGEAWLGFVRVGFVVILLISFIAGIIWLVNVYESKHYQYPLEANSPKGRQPHYGTAFFNVEIYLTKARRNVDVYHHFSPTPVWDDSCQNDSTAVRVLAAVVNPMSGQSTDATMLFCVDPQWVVTPANPEARYLTVAE